MPSIPSPSEIASATPALPESVSLTLAALVGGMQDSRCFFHIQSPASSFVFSCKNLIASRMMK
jgi:hypothetical protein